MSTTATLLRSARRYRGMSGRALARAAGASQPGVTNLEHGRTDATLGRLERLLLPLSYSLTALPTRLGTVAGAADHVREFIEGDRPDAALRVVWQLATDLDCADAALRVALCVTPPATTSDPRFDALLAGVTELALSGLPRPTWLDEPWRTLAEPWDVEPVPSLRAAARSATPEGLAKHGVFLDPAELVNN